MKNNLKICLPIQVKTQNEVINIFNHAQLQCDVFEVWLDYIQDLDINLLIKLAPKPVLCVCKSPVEKGSFKGNEIDRINILIKAAECGANFVDIGFHTDYQLINLFKQNKKTTKLIISHHNWINTPKINEMIDEINKMLSLKPDLIKYVSTANNIYDNNKIFSLAEYLHDKNIDFITMCMGDLGKISRVITPLLGSFFMYAPLEIKKASAPGQIDANTLQQIWHNIANINE